MPTLSQVRMYRRFLLGLRGFMRVERTLEEVRAGVRDRLERREDNLLRVAERGLFGHPNSPYLPLFQHAGCELCDLQALVRTSGVDDALRTLREAGVYFTFEEIKGREPVVRGGREIPVDPSDFDNPYLSRYYQRASGGTTGPATRVSTDLEHLSREAWHRMLLLDAHGVLGAPYGIWRPELPGSGLNAVLRAAHIGHPAWKWFTPLIPGDLTPPLRFRMANTATVALGRAFGGTIPWPEPVRLDEADHIARWVGQMVKEHGQALFNTTVSNGLRVGLAAREARLDLTGATFMIAGEPPTRAKVGGIRATGATHFTDYGMAEAGRLGVGCANPIDENDVHVLTDTYAVIAFPREVPVTGEIVTSFHMTSLSPAAPKLLLNVEFDDFGIAEERDCGCPLGELGLSLHLREIRSFGKLTGEGVSLVGSDMVRILEEVLPDRFGGSALDYQLAEEEDAEGFTRLAVVIHPRLDISDEGAVIDAMLEALARTSLAGDVARAFWERADTFVVRREAPFVTARGKQMPLRRATSETRSVAR